MNQTVNSHFLASKFSFILNSNQKLTWPNVIPQASVAYEESCHNPVTTSTPKPEYSRITVSLLHHRATNQFNSRHIKCQIV